jgi:hypothetical protein
MVAHNSGSVVKYAKLNNTYGLSCAVHCVCRRWKEMENTKLHIIISKLVEIYTVLQEQCP